MKTNKYSKDRPALIALIGIAFIFLYILAKGWQNLFLNYGPSISWIIGLAVGLIALSLCYAIGSERVNSPHIKSTAAAYFFILFNISALGTVNAMFLMFQGQNVLIEETDKAISQVVQLKGEAPALLNTSAYDRYDADVESLFNQLVQEIKNPVNCGQGPKAALLVLQIKALIPTFNQLSTGLNCQNYSNQRKLDDLILMYRIKIDEGKRTNQLYVANQNSIQFKRKIEKEAEEMLAGLDMVRKSIGGTSNIQTIKDMYFNVAERYTKLRQELAVLAKGTDKSIPTRIDTRTVSALGDIGQVIPFMLGRLSEIATYVYIFIALAMDITVISAFIRVLTPNTRRVGKPRGPATL